MSISNLIKKAVYKAVPALKNIEQDLEELRLFKSIFSITKLEDGYVVNVSGNIALNVEKNAVFYSKDGKLILAPNLLDLCPPVGGDVENSGTFQQHLNNVEIGNSQAQITLMEEIERQHQIALHAEDDIHHRHRCGCSVTNK